MKGSTFKRCSCPVEYDAKGRRKACNKRHGSWAYVIDVGRDPATGRRRQLKKSGFRTKDEAESAMAEVISEVDSGSYRDDGRRTVKDFLEEWLAIKAEHLRPTTMVTERRNVARIIAHLGHVRLRDLRTHQVSRFYRQLTDELAAQGSGPSTTYRLHQTFRSALNLACKEGLIKSNPAANATVPKMPRTKVHPWSGEELGRFLDFVASHWLGPLFEIMAMAGIRRGEALALRWQDVNLEAGYIVVRQALVSVAGTPTDPKEVEQARCPSCGQLHTGLRFGRPKTSSGEARIVELGQAGVGVLLAQQLLQQAQRDEWGDLYVDHDLVFAHDDGNPIRPDYVTKSFAKLVKRSGLRHARLHDLRHGRASLLLAGGADIAVVSKILGHSSIRITSDIYAHLVAGMGRKAAEAADSLIVRKPRDQSVTNPAPERGEAPSG